MENDELDRLKQESLDQGSNACRKGSTNRLWQV